MTHISAAQTFSVFDAQDQLRSPSCETLAVLFCFGLRHSCRDENMFVVAVKQTAGDSHWGEWEQWEEWEESETLADRRCMFCP